MSWQKRLKLKGLKRHSLPEAQWHCIWCDRSPPIVTFKKREHVMAESLGGDRDFRLLRGIVCDSCNGGVLKEIDDELNRDPLMLGLRIGKRLGPPIHELGRGIRRDGDTITISPDLVRGRDEVDLKLLVGGGGTVTVRTSGPSDTHMAEHLPRGFYRMAYNAIAHAHGPSKAREFMHLREYVLTGWLAMRAYLLDMKSLNEGLRSPEPWIASYELRPDDGGRPQVAVLRFGMLSVFVSLEPTTRPLEAVLRTSPWLQVAGRIDE